MPSSRDTARSDSAEAPASAIIRDLLKSDELVALPKVEEITIAPLIDTQKRSAEEQAAIKAKRAEAKAAVEYALAAPYPDASEVDKHVFSGVEHALSYISGGHQ